MRVRSLVATAAAVGATTFGAVPPSQAFSTGTVQFAATIGCWGCGVYGPTGNSLTGTCSGVCEFAGGTCVACVFGASFTVVANSGNGCTVSSAWYGTASSGWRVHVGTVGVYLTMTFTRDGFAPAAAHGVFSATTSSVPPCGGSITGSGVGVVL